MRSSYDTGFRTAVGVEVGVRYSREDRDDVHDYPSFARNHGGQDGMDEREGTSDVDVDDGPGG